MKQMILDDSFLHKYCQKKWTQNFLYQGIRWEDISSSVKTNQFIQTYEYQGPGEDPYENILDPDPDFKKSGLESRYISTYNSQN